MTNFMDRIDFFFFLVGAQQNIVMK